MVTELAVIDISKPDPPASESALYRDVADNLVFDNNGDAFAGPQHIWDGAVGCCTTSKVAIVALAFVVVFWIGAAYWHY